MEEHGSLYTGLCLSIVAFAWEPKLPPGLSEQGLNFFWRLAAGVRHKYASCGGAGAGMAGKGSAHQTAPLGQLCLGDGRRLCPYTWEPETPLAAARLV